MLNKPLYEAMCKNFGLVKILNENVKRVEEYLPGRNEAVVHERGENYCACCPLCGDKKFRFTASYQWLTKQPFSMQRVTHLANCYNEGCAVWDQSFWSKLVPDIEAAALGQLMRGEEPTAPTVRREVQRHAIQLPSGLIPLHDLPPDHLARAFVARKYKIPLDYLSHVYGVCFASETDMRYPLARGRLVFPIYIDRKLYGWQGRTVYDEVQPRWYMPPGFVKTFYNSDDVPPHEIPIISEGIPAAIATGPTGIAIFGKTFNASVAAEYGKRWQSAIIATDPETFVPDNRKGGRGIIYANVLRDALKPYVRNVRMITWPQDLLLLAEAHNNPVAGEPETKVPDAADLGLRRMKEILDASF